jgi:hypothetical protein
LCAGGCFTGMKIQMHNGSEYGFFTFQCDNNPSGRRYVSRLFIKVIKVTKPDTVPCTATDSQNLFDRVTAYSRVSVRTGHEVTFPLMKSDSSLPCLQERKLAPIFSKLNSVHVARFIVFGKVLYFKMGGRWFETRLDDCIFFNMPNPSGRTRP